ncbi:MAG: FKBP-type peptidyl-prolyl cis-trans isomerase [Bacteroidales bacterium]|nr:FKBP-type peptidyl-prolyl cis-trans isomerase [Bacteroidales bacterium]
MKKLVFLSLLLFAAVAVQAQGVALKNFEDSASYAIGRDIFYNMTQQWQRQNLPINTEVAVQAMMDCAKGSDKWDNAMAQQLLTRFQQEVERRQKEAVQLTIDAGKKYLDSIRNNKSVRTTESGLSYRCIREGNGKRPSLNKDVKGGKPDKVKVHYTGTLSNGKVFDSSVQRGQPITFALDRVIPGWTEGLQLMDEGSKYMLYIPYNLAYGEHAAGDIPGGSTLTFEVELLEINPEK